MDKNYVYIEFTIGNFYKGLDKHVTERDEEGVLFFGRLRTHKFTLFARLADKANQLVFNQLVSSVIIECRETPIKIDMPG